MTVLKRLGVGKIKLHVKVTLVMFDTLLNYKSLFIKNKRLW